MSSSSKKKATTKKPDAAVPAANGSSIPESMTAIAAAVTEGTVSAREVVERSLARCERLEEKLDAFLSLDKDDVLARADAVDAKRKRGEALGPLAGVPVAIKDNIVVCGQQTTCGSRILDAYVSPYDAHVTERLVAADAVLFGRTNLDEFAMGSSGENSGIKATRNPWDLGRVPGGSSSGSAAAVAARIVPAALGSETGGSVRQPASLTGIVGMKPTYGRVSRYGLVAFGSSLDQISPLAVNVKDCARLFAVIAGHDDRDATSLSTPVEDPQDELARGIDGLRIGVIEESLADNEASGSGTGIAPDVRAAMRDCVTRLEKLGATTELVRLPHMRYGIAAYYVIADSEASANLARFDGMRYGARKPATDGSVTLEEAYVQTRTQGFGEEVRRRIMLGTFALSSGYYDAYYLKACRVRRLLQQDYLSAFRSKNNPAGCDLLCCPTSPTTAFELGSKMDDPIAMYLSDVYTVGANLAGVPAISIPAGLDEQGLPIGFQLIAPLLGEATMFRAAHALEEAIGFYDKPRLVEG